MTGADCSRVVCGVPQLQRLQAMGNPEINIVFAAFEWMYTLSNRGQRLLVDWSEVVRHFIRISVYSALLALKLVWIWNASRIHRLRFCQTGKNC